MFRYLWEKWKTKLKSKPTEAELMRQKTERMRQKANVALIAEINFKINANAENGNCKCVIHLPCKETTLDEYYRNKGYKVETWMNGNDIVMEINW